MSPKMENLQQSHRIQMKICNRSSYKFYMSFLLVNLQQIPYKFTTDPQKFYMRPLMSNIQQIQGKKFATDTNPDEIMQQTNLQQTLIQDKNYMRPQMVNSD